MKLYYHEVSTTSRPILLLAADEGITLDLESVDLFTGGHLLPIFTAINPNQQVPMLDDDGFMLTESSAILKYLADKIASSTYPKGLKERARVNELMDWLNTGFYRDLGYNFIYPQILPKFKRKDPNAQIETIARGREKSNHWLDILDREIIGSNTFLCGSQISIADYFGIAIITLGDITRTDYSSWKNVTRWINSMKARPNWVSVNKGFYANFVAPNKDMQFERL